MFKGEYQGGPFVEVFSAQGRDPISKKCRVTGNSANIHKQYDKDVKSYVYILEGEPTTTKIQLPKDEKQTLFLLQKFLVFQIFIPLGHSFSFELGVTDLAQNKRRIFFSLSQKDITVTPLHAKFPLTVLCLGTWLNLCLDLNSLVGETFSGQTFRALESITLTANCRVKKVFTLKVPPEDNSSDDHNFTSYDKTEPLPRGLQLTTTSDVRPITQVLSYGKLAKRFQDEPPNSPSSVTAAHDSSTPRQDGVQTHIAFGSKVVIPPHIRLKDTHENTAGKAVRTTRSSHSRSKLGHSVPDLGKAGEEMVKPKEKQSLKQKESQGALQHSDTNESSTKSVNANQASIQPRPPRTSSAGKVRRPVRVKSGKPGKVRNVGAKTTDQDDKSSKTFDESEIASNPQDTSLKLSVKDSRKGSLNNNSDKTAILDPSTKVLNDILPNNSDILNKENVLNSYNVSVRQISDDLTNRSKTISTTSEPLNTDFKNEYASLDKHEKENISRTSNSGNDEKRIQKRTSFVSNDDIQQLPKNTENYQNYPPRLSISGKINTDENKNENTNELLEKENRCSGDINNNDELPNENHVSFNKPKVLALTSDNSVFTFASRPRSPRSGKKRIFGSPVVDEDISPVEAVPEVIVNLMDDDERKAGKSDGPRNRGASFEDDFRKLSDDESREDEDGIRKLLHSSLSPRHSPMPFHHHLRQSIRSSMLKEIPSPLKENGYDAQNYQSDTHLATVNQSSASSWRFDTSNSSNSFNQTQQSLEDSLNGSHGNLMKNITTDASGIVGNDVGDDHDALSDGSDDTTFSTWRTPPQNLKGNKYQNEMKPPGSEPDLTATISINPRDYCDVYSPPINLTNSKQGNVGEPLLSPIRHSRSSHILQSPDGSKQQSEEVEEELDLLYDPCLNCYFDPKTHKYYELA